jgi:hypothetical protein
MINKDDLELILSTSPRITKYSSNTVVRGLSLAKELTQNIVKDITNIYFSCSHVFDSPHGDICDFALSPDGKLIVIADKWGTSNIFDLKDNKLLHPPFNCYTGDLSDKKNGLDFKVQIASDSKTLIVFGSAGLKLWDIETGRLVKPLSDNRYTSDKEDFFTDSKTEIIAFIKDTAVQVWDLIQRIPVISLEIGDSIDSFALSLDGRYVVTSSESYCSSKTEEDTEKNEEDAEEEEYLEQQIISVWDISTGNILANFCSHEYILDRDAGSVIISPDNLTLVTLNIESDFDSDSNFTFTTKAWNLQTGKLR